MFAIRSPEEKNSSASNLPARVSSASSAPNPPLNHSSVIPSAARNLSSLLCPERDRLPHFFGGGFSLPQIRCHKPAIPPRIFDSCGAVAVGRVARRVNRTGARTQRLRVNRIRVRHVNMQVARHRLKFSVRLVNFQRRVPDSNRCMVHDAFRRFVYPHRLGPERRLQKWNHLIRLPQVQIRLDRAQTLWPGRPSTRLGDVPMIADRKSTRLNSSHSQISYAVFCLKKKKTIYAGRGQCKLLTSPSQESP